MTKKGLEVQGTTPTVELVRLAVDIIVAVTGPGMDVAAMLVAREFHCARGSRIHEGEIRLKANLSADEVKSGIDQLITLELVESLGDGFYRTTLKGWQKIDTFPLGGGLLKRRVARKLRNIGTKRSK